MKRFSDMKSHAKLALLGGALALAAGPAGALDVYLEAKAYTKTMPDGSTVPMWGYVEDTGGDCWAAADAAARLTCIDGLETPSLPGPRITVDPADATPLQIFLSNGLPEPTSIVIPGQALPAGSAAVFINPANPNAVAATGTRTAANQRVRSYGNEAAANGGQQQYTWASLDRSGTFLYHSGTWPQKQVYMGLYGAVTKDFAAGQVYQDVPYDNEVVLFYSEIDPVLNASIANGTYTTSIDYHAQWFLVNGEPYVASPTATADIPAGTVGGNTLLRFLSAAGETHVPTLQGLYMTIHAEDGIRYQYQNGDLFGGWAPREQYTAELPPLKTKDAIITAPAIPGRVAVYDGNGWMTNPSDPENFGQSDTLGGMLRFLAFAENQPPVVTAPTPDPLSVTAALCANSVPASNQQIVDWLGLATATDTEDGTLPVTNDAPGEFLIGGTLVTFSATDSASAVGTATATVQVAETPNTAPTVIAPTPLTLNVASGTTEVLATDQAIVDWLALATATDTQDGTLTVSDDAPTSFQAALDPGATTTVTFTATDACGLTGTQSSTVTIVAAAAANIAPVANDDPDYVTDQDTPLIVAAASGVLLNDTDPDSGPAALTANLLSATTNGTVVLASTGGFTYTPGDGFFGTDSFTYAAFDGANLSTPATVMITVNEVVTPANTLYFSTFGNTNPPGVAGTPDNADIYGWDGTAFSRVVDVTDLGAAGAGQNLPTGANVDGLVVVDATHFYMSFADNFTIVRPGPDLAVQDEDILFYNAGTWEVYFNGTSTANGLGTSNNLDIDAFDIVNGVLYFSTLGNTNPPNAGGTPDDADIYRWNADSPATYTRVFDASANGLPDNADVDSVTVVSETHFYLSFNGAGTPQTVTVADFGTVQDEDVLEFNSGTWSTYFDGTAAGLTTNNLDVDAVQVP